MGPGTPPWTRTDNGTNSDEKAGDGNLKGLIGGGNRTYPVMKTETPLARSEDEPPYGRELPIENTQNVPSLRLPGDPVIAVRLSLSVWKKLLDRLGFNPDADPAEIQRQLESLD